MTGQIFAVERGIPLFNTLVGGESLNSGLQNWALINQKHRSISYPVNIISTSWIVWAWLTSVTDGETDGRTDGQVAFDNSAL